MSDELYAALTKGAAREGITVERLAAEILHAVVGDGQLAQRGAEARALQAQILSVFVLQDDQHTELSLFDLRQATGREKDSRGRDQVSSAVGALCKRGLLIERRKEVGTRRLWKLREA